MRSELFGISYGLLWLLVGLNTFAVLLLYRNAGHEQITRSQEGRDTQGLSVGTRPAVREEIDVDGRPVHLGGPNKHMQLVIFGSPDCRPCRKAMQILNPLITRGKQRTDAIIIAARTEEDRARDWMRGMDASVRIVADPKGRLQAAYRVMTVPFVMALDVDGAVIERGTADSMRDWLEETLGISVPMNQIA